ncbi:MAG: SdrD B-like domain-containing protein [Anaerolineae bacterium]
MDANGNGRRDADDLPLDGVTVTLKDAAGQIVRTTTTGSGGHYGLDNLPAGTYSLHTAAPADHQAITAQVWGVDLKCATITIDFGYSPQQ